MTSLFTAAWGFLTGNKTTIFAVVGIALAALIAWLFWSRASLHEDVDRLTEAKGRLEAQRDQAIATAANNAAALDNYRREAERQLAAVVAERDAAQARKETTRVIIRDIEAAPPEDDGPAAPVLVDAIAAVDRLRVSAGDGHGDGSEAGAADGAR